MKPDFALITFNTLDAILDPKVYIADRARVFC